MNNIKSLIKKLIIFTPLLLHTVTIAGDGPTFLQNLPPEVLAVALKKVVTQGDYQDFLNANFKNNPTFEAAIESDAVLKGIVGTLQSIKEPMQKVLNPEESRFTRKEALESIMKMIATSAEQESSEPTIRSQILNNAGSPVLNSIKKVINLPTKNRPGLDFIYTIATFMPADYTKQLNNLLDYLSQFITIKPSERAWILYLLAHNKNIPTDVVLKELDSFKEPTTNEEPIGTADLINKAFLALASRPELGKETIEYFKSKESDPLWQQNKILKETLDKFRSNPAYSE